MLIQLCDAIDGSESSFKSLELSTNFLRALLTRKFGFHSLLDHLQAYSRGYLVRHNIKLKHDAASKIQKRWRYYSMKKKFRFFFDFSTYEIFIERIKRSLPYLVEKNNKSLLMNKAKIFFPGISHDVKEYVQIDKTTIENEIISLSLDHLKMLSLFNVIIDNCQYDQIITFISIFLRIFPHHRHLYQHLIISDIFEKYLAIIDIEQRDSFKLILEVTIRSLLDMNIPSDHSSLSSPIYSTRANRTSLMQHEKYLRSSMNIITEQKFYKSDLFFLSQGIISNLVTRNHQPEQVERLIREFIFLPYIQTTILDKLSQDFHDADDVQLQMKMIGFIVKKRFFNKNEYAKTFNQTIIHFHQKFMDFFHHNIRERDFKNSIFSCFTFPEMVERLFNNKLMLKLTRVESKKMFDILKRVDHQPLEQKSIFDHSNDTQILFPLVITESGAMENFVSELLYSSLLAKITCKWCLISIQFFINFTANRQFCEIYNCIMNLNGLYSEDEIIAIVSDIEVRKRLLSKDPFLLEKIDKSLAKLETLPDNFKEFILHTKCACLTQTIAQIYEVINVTMKKLDKIDKKCLEEIHEMNIALENNLNFDERDALNSSNSFIKRRSLKKTPTVNTSHRFPIEVLIAKDVVKFVENFTKPQLPNLEMQITHRKDKSFAKFQISMVFSRLTIGQTLVDIYEIFNLLPNNVRNVDDCSKEFFKPLPFITVSVKNFLLIIANLFFPNQKLKLSSLKNIKQRISIKKTDSLKRTLSKRINGLSQKINPLFE